ncbi:MAG TPA: hypothetical protein VN776_08770 [Terracidiphilus sp.]|nr:hypothetical protein [Terracidiphilus sp.]
MSRKPVHFIAVPALVLLLSIPGCGNGANRQLQSISISPSSASGASASYTATGAFNPSPMTVTPLSVSWFIMGSGIDPPGSAYSLANGNYRAQRCSQVQTETTLDYVVLAVAPADPNAPSSGPIPTQVFQDLVLARTMTSEGGFVAGTAALTCP